MPTAVRTWGSTAFWLPQTANFLVGIDARVALVAGHADTFAYAVADGAVVASWTGWPLPRTTVALAWTGDGVLADLPPVLPPAPDRPGFRIDPAFAGRRVLLRADGATLDRGPARPPVVVAAGGDAVAVRRPGGPERLVPGAFLDARAAADGSLLAARTADGTVLVEVDTGRVVWRGAPGPAPCPSADGRWAVVSAWGGSRLGIVDVARGALHTADGPTGRAPHLALAADRVVIGAGDGAVVLRRSDAAPLGVLEGATGTVAATDRGWVGVAGARALAAWGPDGGPPLGRVALDAKPLGFAADRAGRVLVGRHETGGLCLRDLPDLVRVDPASGAGPARISRPAELRRTLAASPDGRWWLASDPDGTELLDGDLRSVARWGGADQVDHGFAPDGTGIARLREGALEVLDLAGRVVARADTDDSDLVAWAGDAVVTASDARVARWSPGLALREVRALEVRATGVAADDRGFAWVGGDGIARIDDWSE